MSPELLKHFEKLDDPRVERTKIYPLKEILFLIVSGTVSGCDGWKSIRDFGVMKLGIQYINNKKSIRQALSH